MNQLSLKHRPYTQEIVPYSLSCANLSVQQLMDMPRKEQFSHIKAAIGQTPIISRGIGDGPVMQKLEFANPSGSHYDRAYLPTIEYLENTGLIRPGDELRDITSGSAGTSLSLLGYLLGYRVRITIPDELPYTRVATMSGLGAEIVRCGPGYIEAASNFQRTEIRNLLKDGWHRIKSQDPGLRAIILEKAGQRICYVNHSENDISPAAFRSIGEELIGQIKPELVPAAIVLAMGNWTTIAGISPVIRSTWPETRIVGFEGERRDIHDNYGTTVDGIPFRFKDTSLIDETVVVSNKERNDMDKRVNGRSPVLDIGHSSLMGLVVAEKISEESTEAFLRDDEEWPRPVITLAYDQKYRY